MTTDPLDPNDPTGGDGAGGVPDAPRRAASARFDVGGASQESLRDALDPATHSLGDALRLSYRILQLGFGLSIAGSLLVALAPA